MSESENTSNRVYVKSAEFGWLPAKIANTPADGPGKVKISIKKYVDDEQIPSCEVTTSQKKRSKRDKKIQTIEIDINLDDYTDKVIPLQNVDEDGKLKEVEDMVDLSFLHEAAILYNLKARHAKGHPYTRTGDIVIAVNPYQWIKELYLEKTRQMYAETLIWNASDEADPRSCIAPHVYETSAMAYRGLAADGEDQSILVSGESGAGKTETVKILMNHLASVQSIGESSEVFSPIVKKVLDSNPLLEAFGNAKTARNDNSSRFGKFIQLQFDAEDPATAAFAGKTIPSAILAGSKCEVYLLEKSRVTGHEEEERTYHIFYQLLAAPEEKKKEIWTGLENTDNESFVYVGYTDTKRIEGELDAQKYQNTVDALATIGVKDDILISLMRSICIVLQLGNLTFESDPDNEENTIISSPQELTDLAELMGIEEEDVKKALTERTVTARNEVYKVPLNVVKARDSSDALAKEIYSNTFDWLVMTINNATSAEQNYVDNPNANFSTIGLLDIFGFESFVVNRFEQLCINYANEKLQQKFTLDIFRSVQQEYEYEGIELEEVTFSDNADVLDLVEGRMGLISVLNEECIRPKGNDVAFVAKVYTMNKESNCLYKDRFFHDYEFGVNHYAGPVTYDANNFVTKNMDNLPSDLIECRKKSTNKIVSMVLTESRGGQGQKKTPKKPRTPGRRGSSASDTVWTKFKTQLVQLMTSITETRTRYIRCIKPNTIKAPRVMHHLSTVEQLRCAGVVAAVTISRSAFPNRLEHEFVFDRFMCLDKSFVRESNNDDDDDELIQEDVDRLLSSVLKSIEVESNGKITKGFVCGSSRAYFRSGSLELLESRRLNAFGDLAVDIQRVARGFMAKSKFRKLKCASIMVQSNARLSTARKRFKALRNACTIVQCWARSLSSKKEFGKLLRDYRATKIQNRWRVTVAKKMLKQHRAASIKIQAFARGARQRPIYRTALAEAIEEAKLGNQLKTLQRKLEEAEKRRIEAEKKAEEGPKEVVVYKEVDKPFDKGKKVESPPKQVSQAPVTVGQLTSQQQTLMDESGKMLEYLRKEVFKLRSQNTQLRTDFDLLKENNQRLMDANASAGASFAALNQHAKQLSKTNTKLQTEGEKFKEQAHKLNMLQVELKEELKMKQGTYIAEVHSRLQYQKTMGRIVEEIQNRCRDYRLVEDILAMSDDCESDYIGSPTGVNFTTPSKQSTTTENANYSISSRFKSFFAGE